MIKLTSSILYNNNSSILLNAFLNFNKFATSKYASYKQIPITRQNVQTAFMRSSGPGGQSVNTTNSKAQIRIKINDHSWIDQHMISNLNKKYFKYLNKQNELIITSQVHKSQNHNLQTCLDKMKKILYDCSIVKQQRKFQLPQQSQQQKQSRLSWKKKKSQVKTLRKKNNKFLYD